VEDLEKRYPELLAPVLDQEYSVKKTTTTTLAAALTTRTVVGTKRGPSDLLDFTSVMKASQAISDEMAFEQLIHKIMRIVMENVGAQRGGFNLRKTTAILA